jgi:hypothetical protein
MREFAYYQRICENKMNNELIIPIKKYIKTPCTPVGIN